MNKKINYYINIILIFAIIFSIQLYVKSIDLFKLKTININGNNFVQKNNTQKIKDFRY